MLMILLATVALAGPIKIAPAENPFFLVLESTKDRAVKAALTKEEPKQKATAREELSALTEDKPNENARFEVLEIEYFHKEVEEPK